MAARMTLFEVGLLLVNGAAVAWLFTYVRERARILATRADLHSVTAQVEEVRHGFQRDLETFKHELQQDLERSKPLTAEETLRLQNRLNARRDAYFDALRVVYERMAADPMHTQDGILRSAASPTPPSELERNLAYAKMSLFSGSARVLELFENIWAKRASPPDIGMLVDAMRQDLGYDCSLVGHELFPYLLGRERRILSSGDASASDTADLSAARAAERQKLSATNAPPEER
jgi:hypothetical protein